LTDPAEAYLRTEDAHLDRWWERGEASVHVVTWPDGHAPLREVSKREAVSSHFYEVSAKLGPKDLRALPPELAKQIEGASTSLLLGQEISIRTSAGLIRGRLRRFRRGKAVLELARTRHGMPGVMRGVVRTDSSSPVEKVEIAILTCLRAVDGIDRNSQGGSGDGPRP
jgi:hypothetical protein